MAPFALFYFNAKAFIISNIQELDDVVINSIFIFIYPHLYPYANTISHFDVGEKKYNFFFSQIKHALSTFISHKKK